MKPKTEEKFFKAVLWIIAAVVVIVLAVIIGKVLKEGLPHVDLSFLLESPKKMGKEGGIYSSIISTVYLVALGLALAVPIGVGAAIFLTEYKKNGRFLGLIRFTTEALAGIPSIIFGIFGFIFFVILLGMGWSIFSGGMTLALMIIPTMVRTAEEAISSVSDTLREASMALGATKWETIVKVVLPSAMPGIVTGIILGVGRAVGESAAVILTAGSALGIPKSFFDPGRSMAVHLYIMAMEGISMEKAYATGTVLIIAIAVINFIANTFAARHRAKIKR